FPGCSTFAVVAEAGTGRTLVGQTYDMPELHQDFVTLLRVRPAEGPRQLVFTFAGIVGAAGLSEGGIAVNLNFPRPPHATLCALAPRPAVRVSGPATPGRPPAPPHADAPGGAAAGRRRPLPRRRPGRRRGQRRDDGPAAAPLPPRRQRPGPHQPLPVALAQGGG